MSPAHAIAYHAGGLGDFVLSLPALQRMAASQCGARWHYWGPLERLALLPGWEPAPAELLRAEGSLWGESPAPEAVRWLAEAGRVVACAANRPPWLPTAPRGLHLRVFPGGADGAVEWVPMFQARQLQRARVPRLTECWLPRWRRLVLPRGKSCRLVVHAGSGDRAKNLPIPIWRNAAEVLARELSLETLLVEGPAEQERGLGGEWRAERRACATLHELLHVLSEAAILLGNDSGVAHLAGLLGIPAVVAFGPSDPARWRPLGPRVAVVRSTQTCSPCCAAPPVACDHRACLDGITSAAVVAAARGLLVPVAGRRDQETGPDRR